MKMDNITPDISPLPSWVDYMHILKKTNRFVRRMQWENVFVDREVKSTDKLEHGDLLRIAFNYRRSLRFKRNYTS